MIEIRGTSPGETLKEGTDCPAIERRNTMIRELLNIFGMNIMMAEDVYEPSLRVRPRHKIRRKRKTMTGNESNEVFLRMLTAR